MADEPTPTISTEPIPGAGEGPIAWQPFTPRGVAAFATATFGRVFVVQLVLGLMASATLVWFLSTVWFPIIRETIRNLPPQGSIVYGELNWPRQGSEILLEHRPFLAFTVDMDNQSHGNSGVDVTVRFRKNHFEVCSPFGALTFPYHKDYQYEFNQPELEPWWGAWQPILLGWGAIGVMIGLIINWALLATLYFGPAFLLSFYANRQLTWGGSWRLCAAALMPGAIICVLGMILYGLRVLDLFHLLLVWSVHILVGWVYIASGVLQLPHLPLALKKNPFKPPLADSEALLEAMASENPFAKPAPGTSEPPTPNSIGSKPEG